MLLKRCLENGCFNRIEISSTSQKMKRNWFKANEIKISNIAPDLNAIEEKSGHRSIFQRQNSFGASMAMGENL